MQPIFFALFIFVPLHLNVIYSNLALYIASEIHICLQFRPFFHFLRALVSANKCHEIPNNIQRYLIFEFVPAFLQLFTDGMPFSRAALLFAVGDVAIFWEVVYITDLV